MNVKACLKPIMTPYNEKHEVLTTVYSAYGQPFLDDICRLLN